jgi:hypothetical protein
MLCTLCLSLVGLESVGWRGGVICGEWSGCGWRRRRYPVNGKRGVKVSAFIVDKDTIDRVVGLLWGQERARGDYGVPPRIALTVAANREGDDDTPWLAVGQELWNLNTRAVNWRYGEHEQAPIYDRFCPVDTSRMQAYKALRCLLYQCSEGDVPNDPLFQALDTLANSIAHHIVSETPEYQRTKWH